MRRSWSELREKDGVSSDEGASYIFQLAGGQWLQTQKLLPLDGDYQDHFGSAVSLSGNRALVSSPFDDDLGSNSGSAYLFEFDGTRWIQEQKLNAADGEVSDEFGTSVALDGPLALVSAPGDDDQGSNTGSAYLYRLERGQWREEQKLLGFGAETFDMFGETVAVSGNHMLVGTPEDDAPESRSGSVSAYTISPQADNFRVDVRPGDQVAIVTSDSVRRFGRTAKCV